MKVTHTLYDENGDEVEVEFPAHYEVCSRCRGTGKHVNPAVDGHGISPEEFAEDPDFEEAYFSGVYDVTCEECGGERVVLEMDDPERFTPEQKAALVLLQKQWDDEAFDRSIERMERMMGA